MSIVSNSSSKIASLKTNNELEIDDFIIGDKVFIVSNPEKVGSVAYNGTTKFSDGIWIGVSLDQPLGKNNGQVHGKVYFTCENNHGIFVRKNNLKKVVKQHSVAVPSPLSPISPSFQLNNLPSRQSSADSPFVVPTTPGSKSSLALGDRVIIGSRSVNSNNQKVGTLRFLGCTKFAEGSWAGIELDNPVGRNDGSVDGMRYFSCKPLYGLFALEHKVQKYDSSRLVRSYGTNNNMSRQGSCESISSVASNFSSASRTRVRLGLNAVSSAAKGSSSVTNKTKTTRPVKTKDSDNEHGTFQKVLHEKEQHIEQLMREREIEKMSLGSTTTRLDELGNQLQQNALIFNDERMRLEMKISELQSSTMGLCQERDFLREKLDEEKKKVEDLLFRMEEKNIDETDLEVKTEESESLIFELNERLAHEKEQRELLEAKIEALSTNQEVDVSFKTVAMEELEERLVTVQAELNKEKQNNKTTSLLKTIDEKSAEYNDIFNRCQDLKKTVDQRDEAIKTLTEEVNQLKTTEEDESIAKLNLVNDSDLLNSQNVSLTSKIEQLQSQLTAKQDELDQLQAHGSQQTEEQNSQRLQVAKLQETFAGKESEWRLSEQRLRAELEGLRKDFDQAKIQSGSYEKNVAVIQQKLEAAGGEMAKYKNQLAAMEADLLKSRGETMELASQMANADPERDRMMQEVAASHEQLAKLRSQLSEWNQERQGMLGTQATNARQEANLRVEIEELKGRIEFMEKENSILNENCQKIQHEDHSEKIRKLHTDVSELDDQLRKEKEENLILITKNATLYSELETAKEVKDECFMEISDKLRMKEKQYEDLDNRFRIFEEEVYKEKNDELIVIRERLLKVTQEHESLMETHSQLSQKYDREKKLSAEKVRKLERQLDEWERKSQADSGGAADKRAKADPKTESVQMMRSAKENAEQQIAFLNTVIADREKRYQLIDSNNDSLRNRIKDLENCNIVVADSGKQKTVPAPRLYCDHCEEFDGHDTDDCPQSEEQRDSTTAARLSKHKSEPAPRLYCDICELFDVHNTSDCQFEQTF